MSLYIKIPIHKAKSIAELVVRMRTRALNQARDADFLEQLLNVPNEIGEDEDGRDPQCG